MLIFYYSLENELGKVYFLKTVNFGKIIYPCFYGY